MKAGDRLYLVDGSGYIFRAYHALPPLTRSSDGLPVGAISGFCNMLWKLLRETANGKAPSHFAVVFDVSRISFRNEIYPDYKAHRPDPPEDLVPQFPLMRDATKAFHVACLEAEGYEADDLIATYAEAAHDKGAEVVIVSSDKDLMQLIRPGVVMMDPVKGVELGPEAVDKKFGVTPDKVVDVQALAGDSTDNVPGAPGIGVKTAAQLLATYGDLESLLARAEEIKQPKRRETLVNFADQIRISKQLVTLKRDAPMPEPLEALAVRPVEPEVLKAFLDEMEFKSLSRRIGAGLDALSTGQGTSASAPASATPGAPPVISDQFDTTAYETVTTTEQLAAWVERARQAGVVAVDTETDALGSATANLVGISLATAANVACYIPVGHRQAGGGLDFDGGGIEQLSLEAALDGLRPLLADPAVLKVGQNIKYDVAVLSRYDVPLRPYDDTMVISYILEAGQHGHGMDELAKRHFDHTPIPFKSVAGTGKKAISFAEVSLKDATPYAAEDADVTLRLWQLLKPQLLTSGRLRVYERLERPLIGVLAEMENAGVEVDPAVLNRLSMDFEGRMRTLEAQAHEQAGENFNLASPRQVGEILFGKMGLKGGKKTATGAWSTGASALEDLAADGVDLARTVLNWRGLAKLKSTYTDALQGAIHPKTGRVHTSYSMAAAATGRLASTDPNLQNIPIRTEDGRKIRTAFVAPAGHSLLSADYSQIELRILAHMADIDSLKQAFADGHDIHAMTASEIFGVPIAGMDPMVRRKAKAINFGIIYGISAYGLARQLDISNAEAADYIKTYFQRFPGIKDFMEETKAQVREQGYVETLFGRRVWLPSIHAKSQAEKAFAERAAINAPIQGTAADIIKRAMIRMPAALQAAGLSAKMLLQVHDELVFEVPDGEKENTKTTVCQVMQTAAEPVIKLSVPLDVDANFGPNWDEAH